MMNQGRENPPFVRVKEVKERHYDDKVRRCGRQGDRTTVRIPLSSIELQW